MHPELGIASKDYYCTVTSALERIWLERREVRYSCGQHGAEVYASQVR